MREIFVTELTKEVLGPRVGPREVMDESPLSEYITGVLSPVLATGVEEDMDSVGELPFDESGEFEGDELEADVAPTLLTPSLDPRRRPHSMGLSFILESDAGPPEFDFCATWARYRSMTVDGDMRWQREPRHYVSAETVRCDEPVRIWIDGGGEETPDLRRAEVSVHVVWGAAPGGRHLARVFLVNRIEPPAAEGHLTTESHIFQPELRICCAEGTRLISRLTLVPDRQGERQLAFLYRNSPVLARGHLCAAVWSAIDPQQLSSSNVALDCPEACSAPPYKWIDGDLLPPQHRCRFSSPDVRTEFVPQYAVQFPELDWPDGLGDPPELRAATLAEAWDPARLRALLQPISDGYAAWVDDLREQATLLVAAERPVASELMRDCDTVGGRLQSGIELLCSDDTARLSFCFANKAMDMQSHWSRGRSLMWRPFQLAFVLMTLESVVNPASRDRQVCDLLWVPTGVGKTEAYLAIAAFTLAYRRRRACSAASPNSTGAGTSVFSRYTLRLLSIQQFRRAVTMITACEYLRVKNLSRVACVGWVPDGCEAGEGFVWGSSRFAIGLWVGGGVTPNRLRDSWGDGPLHGALSILSGAPGEGEPAQVLACPACGTILSVPEKGLGRGDHKLHLVIESRLANQDLRGHVTELPGLCSGPARIAEAVVVRNPREGYYTLSLSIICQREVTGSEIDDLWRSIRASVGGIDLASARASRPGYFLRYYVGRDEQRKTYDFEIFCPNPECPLGEPWCEGLPAGFAFASRALALGPTTGVPGVPDLSDGNRLAHVNPAFANGRSPYLSERIPISAYTVDDQVYHRCPSMLISTVDKFARPPFEPRASALFGNVEFHHCIHGFYRPHLHPSNDVRGHPGPAGSQTQPNYTQVVPFDPPDLILQDELHLIEGPLGSLVGAYETAVDFLCGQPTGRPVKYIASTATIRQAEEQIQAVFAREPLSFPPPGLVAEDSFFIRYSRGHALQDRAAGRLYLGVCAPGRGPLTPIRNLWARLLHTAWQNRNGRIDTFWTLTGYFNAIRELAGARALYSQDIPERLSHISHGSARPLPDDRCQELSGRTHSTDLPAILDLLDKTHPHDPDAQDALFTTSMFGTGVDVGRLGLMVVHGQPKTTSAYIQCTGRVGRRRGALVVTFLRATRPRDLNHYEFFCGYHGQLHRFVEPVTVYPFSPGAVVRTCGPVGVFLLRNMRHTLVPWESPESAPEMADHRSDAPEVQEVPRVFEDRARRQPLLKRPALGYAIEIAQSALDDWRDTAAEQGEDLKYVEYAIATPPTKPVVLGDPQHEHAGLPTVFKNAPQSLREVEETTGFQTV
jgi:hypothetical protein